MKTMYFENMDAYSESEEAKAENVISIVKRGNTLCADGLITCRKPSTAVKRFFKAVKDWKTFDGWEAEILENIEAGFYRFSEDLEAGRWWEIEEPAEGVFYFAISEIDADTEEEPEEEKEDARAEESAEAVSALEKHVDFYIDFINSAAFDPYEAINNDDLTEYDIEFTIDYQFDFIGARVMIAGGGPNIYIDTIKGAVIGYWGLETVEKYYSETAAELLTDYYRDIYYSLKS